MGRLGRDGAGGGGVEDQFLDLPAHAHVTAAGAGAGARYDPALPEDVQRGRALLALCFEGRFDQVRVALHEYQRQGLDWLVDWQIKDRRGNSAFSCAAWIPDTYTRIAGMQLLLDMRAGVALLNQLDSDGLTALHRFVMLNDIQSVKFILAQEGINVEQTSLDGRTPLFMCAEQRFVHIARELFRHNADVHATDNSGVTVLMAVSLRCTVDRVTEGEIARNLQFWAEAGADLEAADGQCAWRALHYAAGGKFGPCGLAAVKALLRCGASASACNRFGQSPLMVAVCFGCCDVIPALVAAEGAFPSIAFGSEAPLVLHESAASRRDEIHGVLQKAQQREQFKARTLATVRSVWSSYWLYIVAGIGVGVIPLLLYPFIARAKAQS